MTVDTMPRVERFVKNVGEREIFQPWGPPSILYNGYRVSFPRVKRPGRDIDYTPPSSAEVKERKELHLYTHSGPS